ncbi:MAG: cobalt ABC transporter permease [Stappiaceae bacterium]
MMRISRINALLCSLIFLFAGAIEASAHKVIASAYSEGELIEGEIGFSNGAAAKDVVVEILSEDGVKLATVKTDVDGFFSFKPTQPIAHVFKADLGAGHVAEFTLHADDLPRGLVLTAGGGSDPTADDSVNGKTEIPLPAGSPGVDMAAMDVLVSDTVRREINKLRSELKQDRQSQNIQSILGGIGYIIGLFGIGFYLVARHKMKAQGK